MTKKKCLLFDNDGTLVDSEFLNCEAMAAELLVAGIVEDPTHLYQTYSGWQFSAVLDDLQRRHDHWLSETFTEQFRQRASVHFEGRLQAIEHVPEMLEQLDNPKCVASNAPMAKIHQALRITQLASFFGGAIYSAYDINSWKPEPGLFLHAARQMGFDPSECVVIEDSEVGVTAAVAAGINVVHYAPEASSVAENGNIGVVVIESMADLPATLDNFS